MGYSIDLRKRVIQFVEQGRSAIEAAHRFSVTRQTVYNWIRKKKQTGSVEDKPPKRPWRKLNPEEVLDFVARNPELTLVEFATHFGTISSTMCEAFKRLRITRKKRLFDTKSGMKKSVWHFSKS